MLATASITGTTAAGNSTRSSSITGLRSEG
jgi:hypothetical protein